ncbi:hypothetical protein AB0C14_07690 [Microbispora hainanensis]
MRLRFLGLEVVDREARAGLRHVLDGQTAVEMPRELRAGIARRVLPDHD